MANNVERIKANIAKNIREIVQFDLNSEKIDFLTITDIDVSSDHSYAKVYVSFLTNPQKNLENLNKVKGFVRTQLAKRLKLRRVPQISFELDKSFEENERLEKLLKKESEELQNMKK
ncbi:MAG: 30S ribosome-binding factor RbfA [Bacilli bacterium]|nr:30S ribosome-binding factor RbfA [Bacilli bacterium]